MEDFTDTPLTTGTNAGLAGENQANSPALKKPGLQPFAENIWIAEGPIVRDMGILFPTRMTVVRLHDGSLWLSSPVSVADETLSDITALGAVKYLVAATPRHVWRLEGWHSLFPEAQLWISRITPFTLRKVRLPYTGILSDSPPQDWADDFEQTIFHGSPIMEEVIFYHKNSHTVILDDLIQRHRLKEGHRMSNALLRLLGVTYPTGGVANDIRLGFTNRKLARQSLNRMLAWDFDKLIIAHGDCIEKDAKAYMEKVFTWLVK
jgi:hypothetical protein